MDLPKPMIDLQTKQMADDFARRIAQQGLTVEQYFQFTGLSEEKMMEEMEPQAEKRIRTRLVLEAIVKAENIEVTDERLDEELQKMADAYQMEVEKLKEFMGENEKAQMKEDNCSSGCSDIDHGSCSRSIKTAEISFKKFRRETG